MAEKPAIYVLDPYHPSAIAALNEHTSSINIISFDNSQKDDFLNRATAILVRSESKITAAVIQKASSKLRYIVKQGVGVDSIDLDAATQRGIKVYNTPGINGEAVAELTLSLALCVSRRICEFDRLIRNGEKVVRSQMLGKSLFQKTLGIIGVGNIGIELAKKWSATTAGNVIGFDPYAKQETWSHASSSIDNFKQAATMDDLLQNSDVVSLHVPLTKSTRNLVAAPQLGMMKEGSILLNCARGGVVDEDALLEALQSGHLFGAGLDAVIHEPPSLAEYGKTLLSHPRVVVTPHIGASTEENQERSGVLAAKIALALVKGQNDDVQSAVN